MNYSLLWWAFPGHSSHPLVIDKTKTVVFANIRNARSVTQQMKLFYGPSHYFA